MPSKKKTPTSGSAKKRDRSSKRKPQIADLTASEARDMTDSFKHGMMSFQVKHDGTIKRLGGQAIDYLATAERNPATIAAVISKLEGLAEVLPGVLNAAEGKAPGSGPAMYNNQRAIKSAVEMLSSYHRDLAMKVDECEREQARQKTEETWEFGRRAGIAEEQQRAKEARRGRKH